MIREGAQGTVHKNLIRDVLEHRLPQLLKKGNLPPGGILKLWSKVADEGAVCSRSLRHLTLHLRCSEEQEDRCCW